MSVDLKAMSRRELTKLQTDVEKALEAVKARELRLARKAAETAVNKFGFSLDDISLPAQNVKKPGPKKKAAAKSPSKPKYHHPENPDQTWTGKGRQPQWFKDAMAAGIDPGKLEI